jgi:hypothetical protein
MTRLNTYVYDEYYGEMDTKVGMWILTALRPIYRLGHEKMHIDASLSVDIPIMTMIIRGKGDENPVSGFIGKDIGYSASLAGRYEFLRVAFERSLSNSTTGVGVSLFFAAMKTKEELKGPSKGLIYGWDLVPSFAYYWGDDSGFSLSLTFVQNTYNRISKPKSK